MVVQIHEIILEHGAKVKMIQVDGTNFIDMLIFDPSNERTVLVESVMYSRTLMGRITHITADSKKNISGSSIAIK